MDSQILQLLYGLRAVGFHGVRHRDDAHQFFVFCEEERRLAVLRQTEIFFMDGIRNRDFRADEIFVAAVEGCALLLACAIICFAQHRCQPIPRECLEIADLFCRDPIFFRIRNDGFRQRMLALLLQRVCQL